MGKPRQFQRLGSEVPRVLAAAPSIAAAARRLGVDRSTVHRWIDAGKVAAPGGHRTPRAPAGDAAPSVPDLVAPEDWSSWVAEHYELDPTGTMLVGLGVEALTLARDPAAKPADRLAAMGRFQALVKQLDFEDEHGNEATTAPRRRYPRPVVMA